MPLPAITYNVDIPDAPNDPSVDQPKMKVNTNANSQALAVDHYGYNVDNSGAHKQVNFAAENVFAGTPETHQGVLYTDTGTQSTKSEMVYKNNNGMFPASTVRAYLCFKPNGGVPTTLSKYNITSVTFSSPNYVVVCPANTFIVGVNIQPAIIITMSAASSLAPAYTVTGTTITISNITGSADNVNLVVLQY